MRTRSLLFFLTSIFHDTTILTYGTAIDYYGRNYDLDRQVSHQEENVYRNAIYNPRYWPWSQSTERISNAGTIQPSDQRPENNPHRHRISSQKHIETDNSNISNDHVNKSTSRETMNVQYIGLSLIPNTKHNETLNSHVDKNHGFTDFLNSDKTAKHETFNNFTKEEKDCFNSKFIYYNHSCQELFKRGFCNEGEWLVLDLNPALEIPPKLVPKCERKKCKNNKVYWALTQQCYDINDVNDKILCYPGNELVYDYFSGHGVCKCKREPIVHGLFNNGTCFPLYTQGPCEKHHIFIEDNHITKCIRNPCKNSSRVIWEDGDNKCYELESKCDINKKFSVSTDTLKPTCSNDFQLLSIIHPPELCVTKDLACVPEFKVKQGVNYIKQILYAAQKQKNIKALKKNKPL